MDDSGKCVSLQACPCYDEGSVVPPGQVVNKDGVMWYDSHIYIPKIIFCSATSLCKFNFNVLFCMSPLVTVRTANSTALESL